MNAQIESLPGHAEAMDRMYRFQRHIYDASRRYYLLGRDRLLDRLAPPPGGSILEIGCGTGRNLIGAARRYPDARLFGIDISQEMLRTALNTMSRMKLERRVTLACADATSFDSVSGLGQDRFDRVYFSYTLSMVPEWRAALCHAFSLLSEDGELHIVDFGQCEALPRGFRNMLFRWLDLFHVSPRAELRSELTRLAKASGASIYFEAPFRGYTWLATIKRRAELQSVAP
ncbi:MAG TPA: methyltransferase domain-containing protein [Aestuariivirga sp.]|jgi:S-adenosylmethionine-diacylgycerolhomoserine-N-methlytransferase|nr:methyltransferase domain-containing protein [Aestuariivirga sp.]